MAAKAARTRLAAVILVALIAAATVAAAPAATGMAVSHVGAEDDGAAERIEFAPGTDNGTVTDTVAGGATDRYVLRAESGQTMTMSVSSEADTAVFTLWTPSGSQLSGAGVREWSGTLPETGDYRVELASTAGLVSYTLHIRIAWPTSDGDYGGTSVTTERISFEPGTSGATVGGDVAGGAVDRYLLGARAGQAMTVSITSPSGTASFTVRAPDGTQLSGSAVRQWSGALPGSGDYVVDVASTGSATTYTLEVSIVSEEAPETEPEAQLPTPPPGAALGNPVVLWRDGVVTVTDGRYAVTAIQADVPNTYFPELSIATFDDGRIALASADAITVVAPDGAHRSTPCNACRGIATHEARFITARDASSADELFEIVAFDGNDPNNVKVLTVTREIAADGREYAEQNRDWWDVPRVLAAGPEGVIVTYDYRPGGYNARGGDEAVIARYAWTGELVAMSTIRGYIGSGVVSPDGRFLAATKGGSGSACITHHEPSIIDLATLSARDLTSDDGFEWYQMTPFWDDGGVLQAIGTRHHETTPNPNDAAGCNATVTPWLVTFDTATSNLQQGPSAGLTRWVGPACDDVIELAVTDPAAGPDDVAGFRGFHVTARTDGATTDLGAYAGAWLGRSSPADCSS